MGINWSEKNTAELELFFSTDIRKGLSREQQIQAKAQYGENIIDAELLDRQNFYGMKKKKRNIRAMLSGSVGIIGILYFLTVMMLKFMKFNINVYIFLPFYLLLAALAFILSVNTEKKYGYLYKIARPKALVIRQEKRKKVYMESIVPGDVIILSAGDIVPADARLVFAEGLSCVHINADGKAARSPKTAGTIIPGAASQGDINSGGDNTPANIIYAADVIDHGNATAVVIATGKNTHISVISKISKISSMSSISNIPKDGGSDGQPENPEKSGKSEKSGKTADGYSFMQKCAKKMSRNFFLMSIFLSMIIIFAGMVQDRDAIAVIMTCLAVMAASFSEQIPIIIDFALLYGMDRLSKFGVLVKKTSILDEINEINAVIAKKNESFTQDRMELTNISGLNLSFNVSFENSADVGYILSCMAMCVSVTETDVQNKTVYSGSAIDVAVFEALEKCGLNYDGVSQVYHKIGKTIYNPANGIKSALVLKDNKSNLICLGEALAVLSRCARRTENGRLTEFDRRGMNLYKEKIADLYKEHDLIMAVASKDFNRQKNKNIGGPDMETGLDFLGFACFSEPKTSAVFESVDYLKKSGINPVMIADADTIYARSAAVKLGIVPNETAAQILDDNRISRIGENIFFIHADKFRLFSSISLENRIKLLKALKFRKKSPALTINDVEEISLLNEPCLSFTSVNTETGILKNKASVITKNLNVSTILQTVKNSVLIYKNICAIAHFISMLFVSQYLLILFALLFNGAFIFNPYQVLWAGIGAGYILAVSISLNEENRQWHILRHKIKDYKKPGALNKTIFKYGLVYGLLIFAFTVASFMICFVMKEAVMAGSIIDKIGKYINSGADTDLFAQTIKSSQTAAFITYIVSCASISLHYIKSPKFFDFKILKNKIFIAALIINVLAGLAAVLIPPVRHILEFGEISAAIFAVSVLIGICPVIITLFFRKRIFFERK